LMNSSSAASTESLRVVCDIADLLYPDSIALNVCADRAVTAARSLPR